MKEGEIQVITSEQSEWSFYQQSCMGNLDVIQTALKPLKRSEKIEIDFYEWAKRTKFLFTVIYASPWRHLNLKWMFMTILGLTETFIYINEDSFIWTGPTRPDPARPDPIRPDRTRPDRNAFWRLISRKV